jgi:hypothetical protein
MQMLLRSVVGFTLLHVFGGLATGSIVLPAYVAAGDNGADSVSDPSIVALARSLQKQRALPSSSSGTNGHGTGADMVTAMLGSFLADAAAHQTGWLQSESSLKILNPPRSLLPRPPQCSGHVVK